MDTMVDVVVLILTLILVVKECKADASDCPTSYFYYAAEKTCITKIAPAKNFKDAKKSCEDKSDHLVYIAKGSDKPAKMKEEILQNKEYWVGVADLDRDGTFTYMNGSVVQNDRAGAGLVNGHFPLTSPLRCVAYDSQSKEFNYKDCKMEYEYICEKDLDILPDYRDPDACTLKKCFCHKDDWFTFVDEHNKTQYMILNQVYLDLDTSLEICSKLGAELFTVRSPKKHNFMMKYSHRWNPKGLMYWNAIRNINGNWGFILGYTEPFSKYNSGQMDGQDCIASVLQHEAKWRMIRCDSKHQQICETYHEPCTPEYFFATKDGTHIENATMYFQRGAPETFHCHTTGGYIDGVVGINITCIDPYTNKRTLEVASDKEATLEFTVNVEHADNNCTCVIDMREKSQVHRSVQMSVLTIPIVSKKTKKAKHEGKFGDKLVLDLEFYSNPPPDAISFTRSDNTTVPDSWNVSIITPEPGRSSILYIVRVSIKKFSKSDEGKYKLYASRYPDGNFTYIFKIKEKEEQSFGSIFLIILVILALLGLLGLTALFFGKQVVDGEEEAQIEALDQAADQPEVEAIVEEIEEGPQDGTPEGSDRPPDVSEVDGGLNPEIASNPDAT